MTFVYFKSTKSINEQNYSSDNQTLPNIMGRLTPLLSLCLVVVLFSACQEEGQAPVDYNPKIDLPTFNPKFPGSSPENGAPGQAIPLNEHVAFRIPRFPRPLPCPVRAGCQLPMPEFVISVAEDGRILETHIELYTDQGKLYASSSEEVNGNITYQESQAVVSLGVIDDQVSSEILSMSMQVSYKVNGKEFTEKFFEESVPLHLTEYEEAGSVMFRFPRPLPRPRPLPCPVRAGCQIPAPELHAIVPDGKFLKIAGQLYTEEGELYACAGEECETVATYDNEEALTSFQVVNPEIETKNLILALQITYEIDGKVVSEEIYSENVPIGME